MTFIDKLYGHPYQIQPTHIVITSPWFDTGEIFKADVRDGRNHWVKRENAPIDEIIKLREQGLSYDKIAKRLGLSHASVHKWYKMAMQGLDNV